MSLKCLSRNDKPEILLKKRESVECDQRTSTSANIFTEHIKFYRMVQDPPRPDGHDGSVGIRILLKGPPHINTKINEANEAVWTCAWDETAGTIVWVGNKKRAGHKYQAANLRGFRASVNPRFEAGIPDFMNGILNLSIHFNVVHR